ncbi:Cochaperone protein [Sporothrix epigloea]|uniref:Cochaperone protein n=1 Tax=Sporothrix epigloea TaxID=1892477 RepID=A0ABP0DGN6_9PEZI
MSKSPLTPPDGTAGYALNPSTKTAGELGILAIQNKKYDVALAHLTTALKEATAPRSKLAEKIPELLLARSQAYLGLQCHLDLALDDTERACYLAVSHPSTSNEPSTEFASNVSIASLAQYRRAVVLGALKRYADADACCVWSQHPLEGKAKADISTIDENAVTQNVDADGYYTVTPDDLLATLNDRPVDGSAEDGTPLKPGQPADASAAWSRAYMWRGFVLREMQKTPPTDPGRKLTVRRTPPKPATPLLYKTVEVAKTRAVVSKTLKKPEVFTNTAKTEIKPGQNQAKTAVIPVVVPPPTPAKLRVDMYQSTSKVNLSVFAKKVDEQQLQIEAGPTTIRLSNLPKEVSGPKGTVVIQLGGAIDETDITKRVTPYKIELSLTKKTPGEKWGNWGEQVQEEEAEDKKSEPKNAEPALTDVPSMTPAVAVTPVAPPKQASVPKPATSANAAAKSAGLVYPTSSRNGPKDWDKLAVLDDNGDGEDNGDSVDTFFKQLYANSTPEQQRAMNKSFTESNGTALSTDWTSVGQNKVETQPPEGVEAKSWESLGKK